MEAAGVVFGVLADHQAAGRVECGRAGTVGGVEHRSRFDGFARQIDKMQPRAHRAGHRQRAGVEQDAVRAGAARRGRLAGDEAEQETLDAIGGTL